MELTIQGIHVDVGNALREYIESKLPNMIGKYFDNTTDSTVSFSKQGSMFISSIQVHVSKHIIVQGHGEGDDAYKALDEAMEHVLKRLRRYKRRLKDHRSQLSAKQIWASAQYVLQPEPQVHDDEIAVNEPENPIIISEMPGHVETLTVGEAVMRMDLAHLPALLFRNAGSGRVNMVYMRHDGHIGWVDPSE